MAGDPVSSNEGGYIQVGDIDIGQPGGKNFDGAEEIENLIVEGGSGVLGGIDGRWEEICEGGAQKVGMEANLFLCLSGMEFGERVRDLEGGR